MAEEEKDPMIPVRYLGHSVTLKGGPYYNTDGTRRASNKLEPGDTMLMSASEVLGASYWRDSNDQLFRLGAGKLVKPEHAELSYEELGAVGYEFHDGRPDFEPISIAPVPPQPIQPPPVQPEPVNNVVLDVSNLPGVEINDEELVQPAVATGGGGD